MKVPYGPMVGMQVAMTGRLLEAAVSMFTWYSGMLDPRPDLARPARGARTLYAWWW